MNNNPCKIQEKTETVKYTQGQSGNPKGKPKGAKNKTTQSMKELLAEFVKKGLKGATEKFSELDTKEQFNILIKMLEYIVPKVRPVEEKEADVNEKESIGDWFAKVTEQSKQEI